jgi:hypothetical protein
LHVPRFNDETRSDNFILAVTKCPGIADLALEVVDDPDKRRRLVEWLCDAADRVPLSNTTTETVLDALVEYACEAGAWLPLDESPPATDLFWSQEAQAKKDGHAWTFVRRAAMLPISAEQRNRRTELTARVHGDHERAATAAALAATTDALYDARPLTDAEIARLDSLLALPVPSRPDPPIRQQRNRIAIIHQHSGRNRKRGEWLNTLVHKVIHSQRNAPEAAL